MMEAKRADWQKESDFLAAITDRRVGADTKDNHYGEDNDSIRVPGCGMYGPGGECVRVAGHGDTFLDGTRIYNHNQHVSYDTDHHVSWECGWKSEKAWLKLALDELLQHHAEHHPNCKDLSGQATQKLLSGL